MLKVILAISVTLNLIFAFTIHSLKSLSVVRSVEALTGKIAQPVDVQDLQGNTITLTFADSAKPTVIYYFRPKWFRQLDLAPFDLFIWPHPLVNQLPHSGRSEALRRPEGDAFRAKRRPE